MKNIEWEIDRYLTLLRNKIREKGFTQLEVQDALGWGRSYISQLLTKQKTLRVEQVLLILNVIGIEPSVFFGELYDASPRYSAGGLQPRAVSAELPRQQLERTRKLVHGLVEVLLTKKLITAAGLSEAVEAQETDAN